MDQEILNNIYNHLKSNNLTDSDFNTWQTNFSSNSEVRNNIYGYLKDNQLTDSDFNTWENNIIGKQQPIISSFQDPNRKNKDKGYRNNNPLNLKYRGKDEFRVFNTLEEGYVAAAKDLDVKLSGKSPKFNENLKKQGKTWGDATLKDLIYTWAPPSDNSPESLANYLKVVSEELGVDVNTVHPSQVDSKKLAIAMSKMESGHSYQALQNHNKQFAQLQKQQAPAQQPELTVSDLVTADATALANKKVKEKQSKLGFFDKLAYNWNRKGIISDLFDGNGYGADTANPEEIRNAKIEVLQSGKYGVITDAEQVAEIINPKYKEDIKKANTAAEKQAQALEDDFNTEGLIEQGGLIGGFGYKKNSKGEKIVNINPNKLLDFNLSEENYIKIEDALKLKEHPAITADPKKFNLREQKVLNQYVRDIQSDLTKSQKINKAANTGIYNDYNDYVNGAATRLEKELTAKYGTLDPKKMSQETQQKIAEDPQYKEYSQIATAAQKNFEILKSKSANFKLAELDDYLAKEFNKQQDIKEKDYVKLGTLEKVISSSTEFIQDAGKALANSPGDLARLGGTGIDAALDTDLATTSGISKAYNAEKIGTTASKESTLPSRTKLKDRDIYAIYDENNEIVKFTDGNYYTITDDPMSANFKELQAIEKASPDHGKPTTGFNSEAFWHGIREPMVDMVPLLFGSGITKVGLTAAAGKLGTASRLGNTLSKAANSPGLLTFAGSFAGFSGKMMDGAIKDGGLVDPLDIFVATTSKTALEAVIERFNPMEGKIFTDKLFSSLGKSQVKEISKLIAKEGVFKALPIISRQYVRELAENGLGEMMEEVIATIAEPTIVNTLLNATLDTHYNQNFSMKEVAESALVGLAAGVSMGGMFQTPGALQQLRSKQSVLNESVRAALQNKDLFDNIITEQKASELNNKSEEEAVAINTKYDNIEKIMGAAASYSAKVFEENPNTGNVPSSAMQTMYSTVALNKATSESKEYSNPILAEENNKLIEQDNIKLKELDVYIARELDFYRGISEINAYKNIMSSEELATNYNEIYEELKKVTAIEGKSKNSDKQKIDNITSKIEKKIVALKNKSDNKVDPDKALSVEEQAKKAAEAAKAETLTQAEKDKAAKEKLEKDKAAAEILDGKESKNPQSNAIKKELQDNLRSKLDELDFNSPTIADDLDVLNLSYKNLEGKEKIIEEYKTKAAIKGGLKTTEEQFTPVNIDEAGNIDPVSYVERYGGQLGSELNTELLDKDLTSILSIAASDPAYAPELIAQINDIPDKAARTQAILSQFAAEAKTHYDGLAKGSKPVIKAKLPPKKAGKAAADIKDTKESEAKLAEVKKQIDEVVKNKEFIKLSDDGTHYINTKTGKTYKRVSSIIEEKEFKDGIKDNESLTDYKERLVGLGYSSAEIAQKLLVASSQIIGTKVDELVRDFFSNTLKDLDSYDVANTKEIEKFLEQLQVIKDNLAARGEIPVANDIILYNDELGIAGTVDILTYDKEGNIRIYDMKTMRDNNFEKDEYGNSKYDSTAVFKLTGTLKANGEPKYTVVKGAKQDSKRTKHTKQLTLYSILLNNTHGLDTKTLGIMPIEINYTIGDVSTTKLNLLPGAKLTPMTEVNGIKFKKPKAAPVKKSKAANKNTKVSQDAQENSIGLKATANEATAIALATERKEKEALVLNSSYYGPGVTFIEFFDAANRSLGKRAIPLAVDRAQIYDTETMLKAVPGAVYYKRTKDTTPVEGDNDPDSKLRVTQDIDYSLKLQPNDTIYYELHPDSKYNKTDKAKESPNIEIAAYFLDNKVVTRDTPGAVRKVAGIVPSKTNLSPTMQQSFIPLKEAAGKILSTSAISEITLVASGKVSSVHTLPDHEFGNKRDITLEELNKADEFFIVETKYDPLSMDNMIDEQGRIVQPIFKRGNDSLPSAEPVPSHWLGSFVMRVKGKLYKLDTKTLGEDANAMQFISDSLDIIKNNQESGKSANNTVVLAEIRDAVAYRSKASKLDTQTQGQTVEGKGGLSPLIQYFPATDNWRLDGKRFKTKQQVLNKLGERRINIDSSNLKNPKYIKNISSALQTDLAKDSMDIGYRTAPSVYVSGNITYPNAPIQTGATDIDVKISNINKEIQQALDRISDIQNNLLPKVNNRLNNNLQPELTALYEKLKNTKDSKLKKEINNEIDKLSEKKLTKWDITDLTNQKESLEGQIKSAKSFITKKNKELKTLEKSNIPQVTNTTISVQPEESEFVNADEASLEELPADIAGPSVAPTLGTEPTRPVNKTKRGESPFKKKQSSLQKYKGTTDLSWFKTRFAEVGITVSDEGIQAITKAFNQGGSKIWGAFYKASVVLASDANEKVERHEAFHVLFNLFLTPKQQEQILIEGYKRFGKKLNISEKEFKDALLNKEKSKVLFKATDSLTSEDFNEYTFVNKLLNPNNVKTLQDAAAVVLYFEDINFLNGIEDLEIFKKYNGKLESLDKVNYNLNKAPDSKTAKIAQLKLLRRNNKERRRIFLELVNSRYEQENNKNFITKLIDNIKKYLSKNEEVVKNKFEIIADNIINSYKEGNVITKEGFIEEGYEKINFENVVSSSKIGKYVIDNLYDTGFILTGSLAYSPFGSVYRDSKNLLHDIDVVSYNDRNTSNDKFMTQYPNSQLVYDISGKNEMLTYIVPQAGMIITDIVRRSGDTSMITKYTVRDTGNNVLGTFELEYDVNDKGEVINRKEIKIGEEATFVDIFYNQKPIDKTTEYSYNNGANKVILNDPVNGFAAKYKIGREKDKNDILLFNSETEKPKLKSDSQEYYDEQDPLLRIEEAISDLWEDYKDELSLFTESNKANYPKITSFFDTIYKWLYNQYNVLQSYLTNKVTIDSLFYQLENNIYGRDFLGNRKKSVTETFSRNISNITGNNPYYKLTKNWSSSDVRRFSQFINKDLLNSYLLKKYDTEFLTEALDKGDITITDLVKDFYQTLPNTVQDYKNELEDGTYNEKLISEIISELSNPDFRLILSIDLLNSRGIKTKTEDDADKDDQEAETSVADSEAEAVSELENWQKETFSLTPNSRLSSKIREFISNIKKIDANGNYVAFDDTMQYDYYTQEEIHSKLLQELSDSSSPDAFIKKLNALSKRFSWGKLLVGAILGDEIYESRAENSTFVELTVSDMKAGSKAAHSDILRAMFSTIGDQTNRDFSVLLKNRQGSYSLISSNVRNVITSAAAKALSYFTENNYKENKPTSDVRILSTGTVDLQQASDILELLGFSVDQDTVNNILNNNNDEFISSINAIYKNINNPRYVNNLNSGGAINIKYVNEENKNKKTDGKPFTNLSLLIYQNGFTTEQRNVLTIEGETMYNHGISNYLSRQISKIKDNVQDWVDKRKSHGGKPILMHSALEWYDDLLGNSATFDLKYVEGVKQEGHYKGLSFGKMYLSDIEAFNINNFMASYNATEGTAYFTTPVFSDATNKALLNQPVHQLRALNNDTVYDKLYNIAFVELQRIALVKANNEHNETAEEGDKRETGYYNIDRIDEKTGVKYGELFHFLQFLNEDLNLDSIQSEDIFVDSDGAQKLNVVLEAKIKESISRNMDKNFEAYLNSLKKSNLLTNDNAVPANKDAKLDRKTSVDSIKLYYFNQYYYNAAMQIVVGGDLAYYKVAKGDMYVNTEAQKRFKGVDSPSAHGIWENPLYDVLFFKDIKIPTAEETVNSIIATNNYSAADEKVIRNALSDNNLSDAAAYHTLDRREEILKAYDKWLPKHVGMFERLRAGKPTAQDLAEALQPLKPFLNALLPFEDKSSGDAEFYHLAPVQFKNAEILLIPSLAYITNDGTVVKPTDENYENYQYPDLAKMLHLLDSGTAKTIMSQEAVKNAHFSFNDFADLTINNVNDLNVSIPNEEWGWQMDVPSKHEDAKTLIGSQYRKIITGDLDNYRTVIDPEKVDVEEFKDNLNAFIENNSDLFTDSTWGALIDKIVDGEELLPNDIRDLFDITMVMDQLEALEETRALTSEPKKIIKLLLEKALEKEPGSQTLDAYEVQEDGKPLQPLELSGKKNEAFLNAPFKKASKIKSFGAALVNVTSFGFISRNREAGEIADKLKIVYKYDGDNIVGIDYIEAAVPANSKVLRPFMDRNGNIDLAEIQEKYPEILDAFFYRIPTEGKYSMYPIRITKILPSNMGSTIILPKEATSISGLDFDVDKMYGFYRKFKATFNKDIIEVVAKKLNEFYGEDFTVDEYVELANVLLNNELEEAVDLVDPKYNSVLTSLDLKIKDILATQGKKAFVGPIEIVKSGLGSAEARANLRLDISLGIGKGSDFYRDFFNVGSKEALVQALEGISKDLNISYADPRVQNEITAKNIIGKRLIGIFANGNAFHSLIQGRGKLILKEQLQLELGGKTKTYAGFSGVTNSSGERISKLLSIFLFASSEDAKQPVLAGLNINLYTAGLITTMIRLGVNLNDTLSYTTNSFIRDVTTFTEQKGLDNLSSTLTHKDFNKEIYDKKEIEQLTKLLQIADDLLTIERAAKVDTGNVGPELFNVIEQLDKIKNVHDKSSTPEFTISGAETILPKISTKPDGQKYVNTSGATTSKITQLLGYIQVLVDEANQLSPYFNYFSEDYDILRAAIGKFTKMTKLSVQQSRIVTMEIYNALSQDTMEKNNISVYNLYETLPERFVNSPLINSDKYALLKNSFAINERLHTQSMPDGTFAKVKTGEKPFLELQAQLSKQQKEVIKDLIGDLLLDTQAGPEANLGRDFILYSTLFGYNFTKGGYSHLIPSNFYTTEIGQQIRNNVINSKDIINSGSSDRTLKKWVNNILLNNYSRLVHKVSQDEVKKVDGGYHVKGMSKSLTHVYFKDYSNNRNRLLVRDNKADDTIWKEVNTSEYADGKLKDYVNPYRAEKPKDVKKIQETAIKQAKQITPTQQENLKEQFKEKTAPKPSGNIVKNSAIGTKLQAFTNIDELVAAYNKLTKKQQDLYKEDFTKRKLELNTSPVVEEFVTGEFEIGEDPIDADILKEFKKIVSEDVPVVKNPIENCVPLIK